MTTSSPPVRPKAPTAHIVVTCTNRKRQPVPGNLRMQSIRHHSVERRFDAWIDRLATSETPAVQADQLYGGEHWQIARALDQRAKQGGHAVRVWVCSAG
jgi:hypothetical protein